MLIWGSYTTAETFSIVKGVNLINKHKFLQAALDRNDKNLVVDVIAPKEPKLAMLMNFSWTLLLAIRQ